MLPIDPNYYRYSLALYFLYYMSIFSFTLRGLSVLGAILCTYTYTYIMHVICIIIVTIVVTTAVSRCNNYIVLERNAKRVKPDGDDDELVRCRPPPNLSRVLTN